MTDITWNAIVKRGDPADATYFNTVRSTITALNRFRSTAIELQNNGTNNITCCAATAVRYRSGDELMGASLSHFYFTYQGK